jgi:hypothetical protein
MEVVLARAALAPLLVLGVSLAARNAGPTRGGRLLGAPTSTGPFLLLVCLDSGTTTAARAAHGCVTGQLVVVCFCLAYGRLARRFRPVGALLGALGFATTGAVAGAVCPNIWLTALLSLTVTGAGLRTWPGVTTTPTPRAPHAPSWEIPLRMTLAAATVLGAAGVAGASGPFLGGVLSSLPVLLVVMTPSTHRTAGHAAAAAMSRAAMTSAGGTLGFLLTLAVTLVPCGIPLAFLPAGAAMLLGDRLLHRGVPSPSHLF